MSRATIERRLDAVVLLRCAARNGASKSELERDAGAVFSDALAAAVLHQEVAAALDRAIATHHVAQRRQRFALTEAGQAALAHHLGSATTAKIAPGKLGWPELKSGPLCVLAMGLTEATAGQLRATERAEDLAGLIVQTQLALVPGRVASHAVLRASLAVKSLERAFGHRLTADLGRGSHLSAKAGRALAAELLSQPRFFASDGKLLLAAATLMTGASSETIDALRSALIKSWASATPLQNFKAVPRAPLAPAAKAPVAAANDARPLAGPAPAIALPDMAEFSRSVLDAARPVSEGWPGNRKAFICRVWLAIRASRPEWTFSETAFKAMLVEAHRLGRIALAHADLKNKGNLVDVEASAVTYKNSVWHYVRIED